MRHRRSRERPGEFRVALVVRNIDGRAFEKAIGDVQQQRLGGVVAGVAAGWSYVEVNVITLLMALRVMVSSEAPWYSGGYSMAPTPMIAP